MSSDRIKKKNILIVASQEIQKNIYYTSLLNLPESTMIKCMNDSDSILLYKLVLNNKKYKLHIYTCNNTNINKKINYDGLIYLYTSKDSFEFLKEFDEQFHFIYGNKNFPTIYVNVASSESNTKIKFPIISIDSLDEGQWIKIFLSLFKEIKKDKDDLPPYNTKYYTPSKMNTLLEKHKCFFTFGNYIIFLFMVIFSIIDLSVVLFMPDYVNEITKVNKMFLSLRINAEVLNFFIGVICFKYFYEKFYQKIPKMQIIGIIINTIGLLIQIVIKFKIKNHLTANESYFSIQFFQYLILICYIIIYILYKSLNLEKIEGINKSNGQTRNIFPIQTKESYYKFE